MDLLTLLIVVLVIAWLLGGFVFPVGGSLIHLLLVLVVIVIVVRLLRGQSI